MKKTQKKSKKSNALARETTASRRIANVSTQASAANPVVAPALVATITRAPSHSRKRYGDATNSAKIG